MKNAEAVLSVKFKSRLGSQLLLDALREDLNTFKKVPGLVQKYYLTEEDTQAISGIYLFQTKSSRAAFLNSQLAKEIPFLYGVIPETFRVEQYDMTIVLNESEVTSDILLDC